MFATCSFSNAFRSRVGRDFTTTLLVLIGATAVLVAQPAAAIVVVNDTWKDGTDNDPLPENGYSENKVDVDGDGDIESFWTQGGVGTLDPVAANGPLRGDLTAGGTSSGSWTTYFTPEGSEVNLAAAGDKIKVTWAFTLTSVGAANTSQNFRFGLADSSDGARATANGSLTQAKWRGYAIFANMGNPTLGNSNPFQLRRRTLNGPANFLNTSSDFGDLLGNGATSGNHGYDAATPYTMTWEITRNESSGLDHIVRMAGGTDPNDLDNDGLAEVIFTDSTPVGVDNETAPFGSFKYDTFGIRPSGATTTAQIFDTSLFKVEFFSDSVPAGVAGDYNNNNVVDAADYVVWRENNGTTNTLPNDPLGGTIDIDQYNQWKANFGKTPGAGSALGAGAVPEPGTIALGLMAILGALGARRRS